MGKHVFYICFFARGMGRALASRWSPVSLLFRQWYSGTREGGGVSLFSVLDRFINIRRTMSTRNFAANPIFESIVATDDENVVVWRKRDSRGAENGVL